MTLTAIVPIYNEENTIEELLNRLSDIKCVDKIIAIDDNSNDKTSEILKNLEINNLVCIYNNKNFGKGYTIRQALEIAKTKYAIIQDADLELDVNDIYKIYEKISRGDLDVVFGSRFLNKSKLEDYPKSFLLANKMFIFLLNFFTKSNFTDVLTAYKCTSVKNFKYLNTQELHFGFDIEFPFKVGMLNQKFEDVEISFFPRTKKEGKKINIYDAFYLLYLTLSFQIRHLLSFKDKSELL